MGEGLQFLDILIFAAIAAFLVYRLRSALGKRTGHEQQRGNPYADSGPGAREAGDNVVPLPGRARPPEPEVEEVKVSGQGGLTQIKIADPSFEERVFLQGAQYAFGMIVDAFARGATDELRPLLGDDLYDEFSNAIRVRVAQSETLETQIVKFKQIELLEGRMEGNVAFVTVKFVTDQINVTRDEDGEAVDGDPDKPLEVVDIWTFSRNTRSSDPNWLLVETQAQN